MKLYLLYKKDDVIGIFDDKEYVEKFCKENNEKFIKNAKEKVEKQKELLEDFDDWYWTYHEDFDEEIIVTSKLQRMYNDEEDLQEAKQIISSAKWFTSLLTGYIIGQKKFKFLEFELNKMKEII